MYPNVSYLHHSLDSVGNVPREILDVGMRLDFGSTLYQCLQNGEYRGDFSK